MDKKNSKIMTKGKKGKIEKVMNLFMQVGYCIRRI